MRTFEKTVAVFIFGALLAAPALAFDGSKSSDAPQLSPVEAFRTGTNFLKAGDKEKAVTSLQYAAENGHTLAQWKLGRMYAEGDGVTQNDIKAFDYFSRIADSHADDNPNTPQARFVANAFVALGHYYMQGIPNSAVHKDPDHAREMFAYAASYFGDPDAQYYLARLYLDGNGGPQDAKQAARWLMLSANKGQCQAQAMLGSMLFSGANVPRQAARGLMWLMVAKDSAKDTTKPDQVWIANLYDSAINQATEDERELAILYLKSFLASRRE